MRIGTMIVVLFSLAAAAGCLTPKHLALEVNPGCEKIALLEPGAAVPPHVVLEELQGKTKEEKKNMSNWLQNRACTLGADAVIEVVASEGTDGHTTIYNIRGTAVRYTDGDETAAAPPAE